MKAGNRKEWARNEKYKLYRTGELYNVRADHFEKSPIEVLNKDQKQVKEKLQKVLDKYDFRQEG
jgi:hypothetical protein